MKILKYLLIVVFSIFLSKLLFDYLLRPLIFEPLAWIYTNLGLSQYCSGDVYLGAIFVIVMTILMYWLDKKSNG